jgi:hypothetical protein
MLPELETGITDFGKNVNAKVGSKFYYRKLADNTTYPYAAWFEIGQGRTTFDGGTWQHETNIQITFRTDNEDELGDIMKDYLDQFQDNTSGLSVSGWSVLNIQNQFGGVLQEFGDIYQNTLDFNIKILKGK